MRPRTSSGGQKLWDCSGIWKSGNQFLVIGNLDAISFRNLEIWNLVPDYSKVSVFLGFPDPEAVQGLSTHLEEYASWGICKAIFLYQKKLNSPALQSTTFWWHVHSEFYVENILWALTFWELAGNKKGVPKAGATRCLAQVLLRLSNLVNCLCIFKRIIDNNCVYHMSYLCINWSDKVSRADSAEISFKIICIYIYIHIYTYNL